MMRNPYTAPTDDEDGGAPSSDRRPFIAAGLGRRLLGAVVDSLVRWGLFYALAVALAVGGSRKAPGLDAITDLAQGANAAAWVAAGALVVAIEAVLVATRGQSIGKMLVLTRIVDEDGERAGFTNGVLLRMLPFQAVVILPVACALGGMSARSVEWVAIGSSLFGLVDALMILGPYQQCLHDRLAGTYVAIVGSERGAKKARARRTKNRKARG